MRSDAFSLFDNVIFGWILPHPTVDFETMKHAAENNLQDAKYNFIQIMMDAVDSKTSALLTHISLIVAALIFLYTSHTGGMLFKFVVLLELCAYLLLSIFCLRAIRLTTQGVNDAIEQTDQRAFAEEFFKRRVVYNWASSMTVFVTFCMIITLLIDGLFTTLCSAAVTK